MKKRIVIALGGNALGSSILEQKLAVKNTAKVIADLIEEGHEVLLSHGNGPQVGMIHQAMSEYAKTNNDNLDFFPLSVSVSMSQAYIGFDLQNSLQEELAHRQIDKAVATLITQVCVDGDDPAFNTPTKPIGQFMTKEEAILGREKGLTIIEDSGRGYRVVVASPYPKEIVEIETIKALLDAGQIVIAGGGGGIPVIRQEDHLKGVDAVIDKDFTSCLIAKEINADMLIILTAVEKVAINFGKDNMAWLDTITTTKAKEYIEQGHFAPGSMLPKVKAAIDFASSSDNRYALITLLSKAKHGIQGETGTIIIK